MHRADQALGLAGIADCLTRRSNARGQRRLGHDAAAPNRLEKIVPAHNSGAVGDKANQHVEDLRLDGDKRLAAAEFASVVSSSKCSNPRGTIRRLPCVSPPNQFRTHIDAVSTNYRSRLKASMHRRGYGPRTLLHEETHCHARSHPVDCLGHLLLIVGRDERASNLHSGQRESGLRQGSQRRAACARRPGPLPHGNRPRQLPAAAQAGRPVVNDAEPAANGTFPCRTLCDHYHARRLRNGRRRGQSRISA